jgi:basic amino acid/polyamine antiporter, APA family
VTPSEQSSQLVRALGRWTLTALVINSIIGSGIFGLPADIAAMLGGAAVIGWLIAAAGNGVIIACFAEVASRFTAAGGAYLYARESMGRFAAIQVGWLSWLTRIASAAANANLFTVYLGEVWPGLSEDAIRVAVLALLLGLLAAVNIRGVKAGGRLNNVFTIAKLAPLALLALGGAAFIAWRGAAPAPVPESKQWLDALLLLAFAYGGFDGAMMPMSEAKDPRRDAPFALFVGLLAITAVYASVQFVTMALLPDATASERPLADAARVVIGRGGALLMMAGALISVYGFLGANVLNVPRLTFALAERGDFPPAFAWVHSAFRTPWFSICALVVLVWVLAAVGDFRWNAVLSAVARLFVYGSVCLSLLLLRKQQGPARLNLRLGPFFAVLGIGFCLLLMTRMGRAELYIIVGTAGLALLNWLWARRRTPEAA